MKVNKKLLLLALTQIAVCTVRLLQRMALRRRLAEELRELKDAMNVLEAEGGIPERE